MEELPVFDFEPRDEKDNEVLVVTDLDARDDIE